MRIRFSRNKETVTEAHMCTPAGRDPNLWGKLIVVLNFLTALIWVLINLVRLFGDD